MIKTRHSLLIFGACAALVLAVMVWGTISVSKLDRQQYTSRRQAEIEERVRLALWRMDSALAPIINRERTRPYFSYNSFYPAERAYTRMFAPCLGVLEDPATGGASGPLGSYLFHHNLVTAQQASNLTSLHGFHMGRPSNISISLRTHGTEIEGVRVGGVAVLVSTGQFSSRLLR